MPSITKAKARKRLQEASYKIDKAMMSRHYSPACINELFKMRQRLMILSEK